jgi:putative oxidoreductase
MPHLLTGEYLSAYAGYAPFFLRVATGLVFAMHGYQKLTQMGIDGVSGFLSSLGFPLPMAFAFILIAVELVGGIALILGAFTRITAKLCAIVALVALVTVHLSKGFFISNGGYEFILLIFAASLSLMLTGAGAWAVDNVLRKQ